MTPTSERIWPPYSRLAEGIAAQARAAQAMLCYFQVDTAWARPGGPHH